jgi:hypothetical protein
MSEVFAFTVIERVAPKVRDESAQVVDAAVASEQVTGVDPINTVTWYALIALPPSVNGVSQLTSADEPSAE